MDDPQRMRIFKDGLPIHQRNALAVQQTPQTVAKLIHDPLVSRQHLVVVQPNPIQMDAQRSRLLNLAHGVGDRNEGFGRDASDIQTDPPKPASLNESHPQASPARRQGCDISSGTAADDREIVSRMRTRRFHAYGTSRSRPHTACTEHLRALPPAFHVTEGLAKSPGFR